MLFDGGFTFANFLVDAFAIFIFLLWLWLLITVFSDLFRRHDLSGLAKVIWVIVLVVLPYIGIFAYILTQSSGIAEREVERVKKAQDNLRQIVGFSAADELEKLDRLKSAGTISETEYSRLRARALQF
jgi:predicted membrane channel-forming protein YqfA (hemolysin III family)